MKRIFVWFGLAAIAVAAGAASCSINHRSGQFECEVTADCDRGRTCSEGLCVTSGGGPDGGPVDGGPVKDAPMPDAMVCPSQCTRCEAGKVCVIDCAAPGANCFAAITCPAGYNCDIRCSLQGACRAGINCSNAASCNVQCTGRASCRGVACGPGPCNVSCPAAYSCESVTCGSSCACDVACGLATGTCLNVQCTRTECDTGKGCASTLLPVCDTCP